MPRARILAVDKDPSWTLRISEALGRENYELFSANSVQDAILLLEGRGIDLLITELDLPEAPRLAFVEQVLQTYPNTSIIIYTSQPNASEAHRAGRLGVLKYLEKSSTSNGMHDLRQAVREALSERCLSVATRIPDPSNRGLLVAPTEGFYGIISRNSRMLDIFELIQTIADSVANVLIQGETGTGKELVAKAIHDASSRHGKPFVTLDCSALARELLVSELFGHEKGAFTGATERHIGRFERANGGTLFLDEVSNIDLTVQAKLLRVLQTKTFERVGGQKSITVDVRIVAATNRSLEQCVAAGTFRDDLYHRLNVVQIELPPLRERPEDISLLAEEFLRKYARQHGKDVRGYTEAAMAALNNYRWPGNVRELENVVLQAVVLAKSPIIDAADLPRRILESPNTAPASGALADQLGEPEKQILINTLRKHGGNIKRSAAELQISRTTLYAKLRRYQIDPDTIR